MKPAAIRISSRPPRRQSGIALIEALIGVLLLSLGILGLIGLQGSMSANLTDAKYRAEASFLANQLLAQMWVDQTNLVNYAISSGSCTQTYAQCSDWLAKVAQQLPNGSASVVLNGNAATITVMWSTPGVGLPHNYVLSANVLS
jgi:type IV pilus assembly protein PilV